MGEWANEQLGRYLKFRNGKTSPDRSETGSFTVFGSNGAIGRASEANARADTIIIGRVGTYCGSLHYSSSPCWVTDNAIICTPPKNEERFWFYALSSLGLNNYRAGSGQPLLNQSILKQISFRVPPSAERLQIGAFGAALDDKIELNRRMNETLEAMARAIFKDWFVDFGPTRAKAEGRTPYLAPELWNLFPDALDDDGKPSSWVTFTLSELVHYHRATVSPGAEPDSIFEHYSIPAHDTGKEPKFDSGGSIKSNKTVVPEGAVLLSKLNPEIERVWLPHPKGQAPQVASTEFLAFTPIAPATRSILFCLFKSKPFREEMAALVTGTSKSHQRVSPKALLAREVLVADKRLLGAFDDLAHPFLDRLLKNRLESRTLAQTRDLLLPKLMSGEIRVGDAEELMEAVS